MRWGGRGENAAPGSAGGKIGTPTAETAGAAFTVTVSESDATWNVVSNVTDTVGLSSSDTNASLPSLVSLPLLNLATTNLSVTLKTAGTTTLTASDASDPSKNAYTSPSIAVNAGALTKLQLLVPGETAKPGTASGKSGTPVAETAGAAFTVTANAVDANWNLIVTNHVVGVT